MWRGFSSVPLSQVDQFPIRTHTHCPDTTQRRPGRGSKGHGGSEDSLPKVVVCEQFVLLASESQTCIGQVVSDVCWAGKNHTTKKAPGPLIPALEPKPKQIALHGATVHNWKPSHLPIWHLRVPVWRPLCLLDDSHVMPHGHPVAGMTNSTLSDSNLVLLDPFFRIFLDLSKWKIENAF